MTDKGCKQFQSLGPRTSGLLWIALLAFSLLLAGCGIGIQEAVATPSPSPTEVRTPRPTFTPEPVATPTSSPTPTATATPTVTPTPTRREDISPLTGLQADPELLERRILAVRIGNDPVIRPQDGLGTADIVYEEIMDGWVVTRFTALFLDSEAERLRPIRSARLVNLSMVPQYDAALAHTGASDPIRWKISQADFCDLDEFFHPQPYRILPGYDWRGRIYTSTRALWEHLERIDQYRGRRIEGYPFDPVPPDGEPAQRLHIPYPRSSEVVWQYDPEEEVYLRYVQGVPHIDGLTREQIRADNVIVFYTEHRATDIVEDALGSTAIDIVMDGSGPAAIYRDGVRIVAEWRSAGLEELILYYDEQDDLVPLRPGKTWIQLVPLDYDVTFE